MSKKILISLTVISMVAAIAIGGTIAYFSDTETSTGNTFTAGAIDLKIDNESYYFGPQGLEYRDDLSWELDNLTGHLFFNYEDLKPGDWGEDTVSIHVDNNDAWVCVDLYVTRNDDMSSTEPELEEGDAQENPQNIWDGELAQAVNFFFWVDDGDNVYEVDEELLIQGSAYEAIQGLHYALADSQQNNVGGEKGNPLTGGEIYWIGKIWCFGDLTVEPVTEDTEGPIVRHSGVTCNGFPVDNMSQTDAMMVDLSFYAEQARHNGAFVCSGAHYTPEGKTILRLENKDIDGSWDPYLNDGVYGELRFISAHPTFDYELDVYGLVAQKDYSLIYYADPWPGNNPGALIGTLVTDANGDASVSGDVELGIDLPHSSDANYSAGAKLWVVKSEDYDSTAKSISKWPVGAETLFEWNLVKYDDTDI